MLYDVKYMKEDACMYTSIHDDYISAELSEMLCTTERLDPQA